MAGTAAQGRSIEALVPDSQRDDDALYDYRFRRLIAPGDWAALPDGVRRRFSKRLSGVRLAIYRGEIVTSERSAVGWLLAQLCRVIGAPLPLSRDSGVAAVVTVGEDSGGGQCWTRQYARRRGFPQVIHSAKRFAGATGLEEHVGMGVGMTLTVAAHAAGIRFRSADYFWQVGGLRFRLPPWIGPGVLTIDHIDQGDGEFLFVLSLRHVWFGEVMHQVGRFRDPADGDEGGAA